MISVENNIGGADLAAPPAGCARAIAPCPCGAEVAEDVLHHDDGRVDDDAEVDRAERDEVRRRAACATMPLNATSSASGMLSAVMSAARAWPRKSQSTTVDEHHADEQVLEDGVRRQLHQLAAVVVRLDVHARRQQVVLADVVDALVDALERLQRVAAVAHEHDALHDVGLVVLADDAEARRVADSTRRRRRARAPARPSARRRRRRRCRAAIWMRPMPRTLNDCSPSVRRWPPTFWLALRSRVDQLRRASRSCPLQADRGRPRRGTAWSRRRSSTTSMTPGTWLELPLEDPVLAPSSGRVSE